MTAATVAVDSGLRRAQHPADQGGGQRTGAGRLQRGQLEGVQPLLRLARVLPLHAAAAHAHFPQQGDLE